LEVWRGVWQGPTIRIWGAGWLCRPEVDRFRVGTKWPPSEVVFGIRCFGRGRLTIADYTLKNLRQGELAELASIRFEVEFWWPAFYTGTDPKYNTRE